MQPKLKDFHYIPGMDIASFFELDEQEAKLAKVLRYEGLVTTAKEHGVGQQAPQQNRLPRASPRNPAITHNAGNVVSEPRRRTRGIDNLRRYENHARLANLLQTSLENMRQISNSLRSLNDTRERRNE